MMFQDCDPSALLSDDGENDRQQFTRHKRTFTFPSGTQYKRKSHKSHAQTWNTSISSTGYASCLLQQCNFISSDVQMMSEHYRICDGIPKYDVNYCTACKKYLLSSNDLVIHKRKCSETTRSAASVKTEIPTTSIALPRVNNYCISKVSSDLERGKSQVRPIQNHGYTSCNNGRITNQPRDMAQQVGNKDPIKTCSCGLKFNSLDEYLLHAKSCGMTGSIQSEKQSILHFKDISKSNTTVQQGPPARDDEYRRRRSYTKQHLMSWIQLLEENKRVICHFQNCNFLAMSLEDIISHFGYCNGDGSFAKYACPYCKGRVTTTSVLKTHIERSHPEENAVTTCSTTMEQTAPGDQLQKDSKGLLKCPNLKSMLEDENGVNVVRGRNEITVEEDPEEERTVSLNHLYVPIVDDGECSSAVVDRSDNSDIDIKLHIPVDADTLVHFENDGNKFKLKPCVTVPEKSKTVEKERTVRTYQRHSYSNKKRNETLVNANKDNIITKPANPMEEIQSLETNTLARNSEPNVEKLREGTLIVEMQVSIYESEKTENNLEGYSDTNAVREESTKIEKSKTSQALRESNSSKIDNSRKIKTLPEKDLKIKIAKSLDESKAEEKLKITRSSVSGQATNEVSDIGLEKTVREEKTRGCTSEVVEAVTDETLDIENEEQVCTADSSVDHAIPTGVICEDFECMKQNGANLFECKMVIPDIQPPNEQEDFIIAPIHEPIEKLVETSVPFEQNTSICDTTIDFDLKDDARSVSQNGIDIKPEHCTFSLKNQDVELSNQSKTSLNEQVIREACSFNGIKVQSVPSEPIVIRQPTEYVQEQIRFEENVVIPLIPESSKTISTKTSKRARKQTKVLEPITQVVVDEITNTKVRCSRRRDSKKISEEKKSSDNGEEKAASPVILNIPEPWKEGRKRRLERQDSDDLPLKVKKSEDLNGVACGKCGMRVDRTKFPDHNSRIHVGLGWMEGEDPIDYYDESVTAPIVKREFKSRKSTNCEKCQTVIKSAVGFLSHIQKCGKTAEEKEALKVQCSLCPSRVLKCSLRTHMQRSHPEREPLSSLPTSQYEDPIPGNHSGKRRSALRAVSKFREVLGEGDADDERASKYVFYKKGSSKMPKIPSKIISLRSKMKKEQKEIRCRASCEVVSDTVDEARGHLFLCPNLPQQAYICECCDYYTESETLIREHVEVHISKDEDYVHNVEAEEFEHDLEMHDELRLDDIVEENIVVEPDLRHLRTKSTNSFSEDAALEAAFKRRFMNREGLHNKRGNTFYSQALKMTMEDELEYSAEEKNSWTFLNTTLCDWKPVSKEDLSEYLPKLEESMSIHLTQDKPGSEISWRKFRRFEGDLLSGVPVMFTGGKVRAMSWCHVSVKRMIQKQTRQYLAVSSGKDMDQLHNPNIRAKSSNIIQIWDCGVLENDIAREIPRMVLGIAHESGEVWDLAWVPTDCFQESSSDGLRRIGLVAAACQDGTVRIWSVCDPSQLVDGSDVPIYKIEPSVILALTESSTAGCLKLAINRTGMIVGGFTSGVLAVWNLNTVTSVLAQKQGKSKILKSLICVQAHRNAITGLALCPSNDRYVATGSLDRKILFWNLDSPECPFEMCHKEACLNIVWPRHWPLAIFNFEDIVPTPYKGFLKMVRNIFSDKKGSVLVMDNLCWSLTFSDWLNTLCGCNNQGEVRWRFIRNLLVSDERSVGRNDPIISSALWRKLKETSLHSTISNSTAKANNCDKADEKKKSETVEVGPRDYEEANSSYGLVIIDYTNGAGCKQTTKTKTRHMPEEYPIVSVNQVCFNPNFKSFSHLAVGYHCGLVRIQRLSQIEKDMEMKRFLMEQTTS